MAWIDAVEVIMADDNVISFSLAPAKTSDHRGAVSVTKIEHIKSGFMAFAYQCRLEEDFDGAPRAYGLDNPQPVDPSANPDTRLQRSLKPLDRLGNATSPYKNFAAGSNDFSWAGLYATTQEFATKNGFSIDRRPRFEARRNRRHGEAGLYPAIQPAGGPAPGYFVSTTAAVADPKLPRWDQRRYVNAAEIPYAAMAWWWPKLKVHIGDFGLAIRPDTGTASGFVFADSGTAKVGEVSHKLLETLSPGEGPGTRNEHLTLFLVFPGSGSGISERLKYRSNSALQRCVTLNVRRLNTLPDNRNIPALLAHNADLARYQAFKSGRPPPGDFAIRYRTVERALVSTGFVPYRPAIAA
jgi:hypothetical protein